jgi:hypothetical protein
MRIGEVLELPRKDLDIARGVVRVERAVARVAGRPVVGPPKSAANPDLRRAVGILDCDVTSHRMMSSCASRI